MIMPSWDDAPEWATVLLGHVANTGTNDVHAFADAHADGARFTRSDIDFELTYSSLDKDCWELLETRPKGGEEEPEPTIWDGEKMVSVGDKVAFKYSPDEPWTITHIGTGLVCYTDGDGEYSAVHGLFRATVVPYQDGLGKVQQVIKKMYGRTVGRVDIEDFLKKQGVI